MSRQNIARVILIAVALVVLLVFFVLRTKPAPDKTVVISGMSQCSSGIDGGVVDHLGLTLYGYVRAANNYNHRATLPYYKAAVRQGSCQQKNHRTITGANGRDIEVSTSSAIVDIPDAKQSWGITYDWAKKGDADQTDLGALQPTCLSEDQLRYGSFGCSSVVSIVKYGTPYYDPILQYVPYDGSGFKLEYDPKTKHVTATMQIPAEEKGNTALIQNDEAIIPYWFEHRGLDISKYNVTYTIQYQ
jgi:hypothetical protein